MSARRIRKALTALLMVVAMATPSAFLCRTITKKRFRKTFRMPEQVRYNSGLRVSPIIDHQKGHPEKIDPQVSDGHTHDIFRRAKECEDWLRDHLTEHEHEKPADQGNHEAGVKGFVDFVTVSGADKAGQHDIGSDGQTAEEGHNHVDHRRIGADGCHCQISDNCCVRGIKQLLQDAGQADRDRDRAELAEDNFPVVFHL